MDRPHYAKHERIADLWEKERSKLLALPATPFEVFRLEAARLNKYRELRFEKATYPLPQCRGLETVLLKVKWDEIEVLSSDGEYRLLGKLPRPYADKPMTIEWTTVFDGYRRKPRSVMYSDLARYMPPSVRVTAQDKWMKQMVFCPESLTLHSLVEANASHIKNLPGRKTDKKDAQWIAELHRCGLVSNSFVAPREIRELRDLTRYRKKLKGYETSERNRIIKVLEDANIKISTFMSDVFGKSGRLMLDALVNGEVIEPEQIADLAIGRLRPKIPELTLALNGRVTLHHRKIIQRSLEHLKFLEKSIADLEAAMEQYFVPYQTQEELLQTIPGVGPNVAKVILAEIGTDMSVFPSASHLSSWAGLSPGNHESAGKKKIEDDTGQSSVKNRTFGSWMGCQ
ncbi:IS110 family transposase [Alicyclobacillus acidiphilus]|uniref:IS110 family transposase n=1 Tax=Alicyclobacillus acidiphilus TaxID=182455 RepID=UPI000A54A6E1|nr:IS110 family transposase [Alicyclobacillus acidiphilus]